MAKMFDPKAIQRARAARPMRQIYQAFRDFTNLEASGGIVLMIAAVVALGWANSPWAASYDALWHVKLTLSLGTASFAHDLHWWINEALMVIFFFVVGLEIKREVLVGELASLRQAALPFAAALGGMLVPALFYTLVNLGGAGARGWGVPMATDIAFALGVLALLGARVPLGLKIFLTALAIVDDIGAVLVIALFYTSSVAWGFLAAAGGVLLLLLALNRLGGRNMFLYSLLGILLWLMVLGSGLHATLAGVLLAVTIPSSRKVRVADFVQNARAHLHDFEHAGEANPRMLSRDQQEALLSLESSVSAVEAPLQKMEHALHPWVTYAIIPLFALANAGVALGGNFTGLLLDRVSLGIIAGLVLGKQVGVSLGAWAAVRLGLAQLPAGVTWRQIYAAGWLAGIGFTMSLFIADLAFVGGTQSEAAKVGILAASLLAGLVGYGLLRRFLAQVQK